MVSSWTRNHSHSLHTDWWPHVRYYYTTGIHTYNFIRYCIADFKTSTLRQRNFVDLPFEPGKLRADILHKNSFYYNQNATVTCLPRSVTGHCCEWKECRTKFLSSSDLIKHVQEEHLACLPLHVSYEHHFQRKLTCQWRTCSDNRCYPARYKLLLHLQRCHCSDNSIECDVT